MWNIIKRGFGYGFGGRIGWELGGFVWRWATRAVMAVVAVVMLQCGGGSVKTYNEYQKAHPPGAAKALPHKASHKA